ncbi:MAG: hypothetical protein HUU60_01060 [Armatimonadetes bacterium]|nr:hypothetical protein [Armatimonadota bacterium]
MPNNKKTRFLAIAAGCAVIAAFSAGLFVRNGMDSQPREREVVAAQEMAAHFAELRNLESSADGSNANLLRLFANVLFLVRQEYVEKTNTTEMAHGSLESMLASLNDPHSLFFKPDETARLEAAANGKLEGIGASLTLVQAKEGDLEKTMLKVVAPFPNSPAERAGLLPGDYIDEVDGKWVISHDPFHEIETLRKQHAEFKKLREADQRARARLKNSLTLSDAVNRLTSFDAAKGSTNVSMTVIREGKPVKLEAPITRLTVAPVGHKAIGKLGYVRVNFLGAATPKAVEKAIDELRPNIKGIVLDLRNAPGGQIEPAKQLLSRFVPGTALGQARFRADKAYKTRPISLVAAPKPYKIPMVVLVNKGTYNVAEFVASALKNQAKSALIGEATFGDASEIALFKLSDNSGFTLTLGRYLNPDGTEFHGTGVQPQVKVAEKPTKMGDPAADPALKQAISTLTAKVGG